MCFDRLRTHTVRAENHVWNGEIRATLRTVAQQINKDNRSHMRNRVSEQARDTAAGRRDTARITVACSDALGLVPG